MKNWYFGDPLPHLGPYTLIQKELNSYLMRKNEEIRGKRLGQL